MQIKKKTLWLMAAIFVVAIFGISTTVLANGKNTVTGNAINEQNAVSGTQNGDVQEVTLKYKDYVYVMEPSTLKAGIPVKMTVDLNSVRGCMTAVRIPAFGVSKNVGTGDNVLEFTPDRIGTFSIACSMGMGATTFDVVDNTGSTGGYVEKAEPSDLNAVGLGSCSGDSGGCGCGGF